MQTHIQASTPVTKACTMCHEVKPISDFYRRKGNWREEIFETPVYRASCKVCDGNRTAVWYRSHPEKVKARRIEEAARVYLSRPNAEPPPPARRSPPRDTPSHPPIDPPDTKVCSKCGVTKSIVEYRRRPNGHMHGVCKTCQGKAINDWKRRNPEKVKDQVWRAAARKYLSHTSAGAVPPVSQPSDA